MGKSFRNNGKSNGADFDSAFDEAVTGVPLDKSKKQPQQEPDKKVKTANEAFNFDAAFDVAVKKKEEPTDGANSGSGSTTTSPSKSSSSSVEKKTESPFTFKRQVQNGGLSRLSQELRGERNFENKKLTEEDVDVLATTKFGTEKGLDIVASSPASKKYFISAHNGEKESELIQKITPLLPQDNPQLSESIINGDINSLNQYKTDYLGALDKKIGDVENKHIVYTSYGNYNSPLTEEQKQYVNQLKAEKENAESVFHQYAQNAIVNKRINLLMAEGTPEGLEPGMLAKEIGKQIETDVLPNKYFQQREEVYQQFKTFSLLQKEAEELKDLPAAFKTDIDERLKTIKDNQLYAKENIEYDRENIGLTAILRNLSMKVNDLISTGIATKDVDLLQKSNNLLDQYEQFKTAKDNLLDRYPDVGISQTAQILSDRISSKKGMRPVFISNKDISNAAAEEEKETGKFLEKYGKFINYVNPTSLPKGGLMGNMELGFEAIGQKWFGDHTDLDDVVRSYNPALKTTALSGGQPIQIAYDKEGKAYKEMDNENYQTWDFNNSMRVVGQGLPHLAEFILLERGIGGIAGLVGKAGVNTLSKVAQISSKLSKAPVTAEELAATREALKFSQGFKNTLGLTGAMYVTSYDQNRELADELIEGTNGKDEFKKDVLANALTLLSVAAFKAVGYSPSKAVQRSFAKGIAPDAMELLEKQGLEGLSKEATNKLFQDIVLPKAQAAVKSLGVTLKGAATGAGAVVLDENMKGMLSSIVNPEKGKLPTAQEDIDSAISQVMLMTAVGLPGMVMGKTKSVLTKDALYEAGLRYPQFEGFINKEVANGKYTPEQANEMISIIKTMGQEAYKVQSETTDNGLPLTVKQKRDLAYNNFKVRAAKMLEEKGHDVRSGSVESEATKENNEIKRNPKFEEVEVEIGEDGMIRVISKAEQEVKSLSELPQEQLDDLFIRSKEKATEGLSKSLSEDSKQKSIDFLRDQSLDTPNALKDQLNGDEKLTIDIISSNPKEEIQKSIDRYESELKRDGNTELRIEEIDRHISLLDKGLQQSEISQPKTQTNENQESIQSSSQKSGEEGSKESGIEENAEGRVLNEEGAAESSETGAAPLSDKNKSIIEEDVDLKGNKKAAWMRKNALQKISVSDINEEGHNNTLSAAIENVKQGNKSKTREAPLVEIDENGNATIIDGHHRIAEDILNGKKHIEAVVDNKFNIRDAIKNGEYQKAMSDGKMTAADAKEIIESAGLEVPANILSQSIQKPRVRVSAEEMQAKQPTFEEGGVPPISEPPNPSRIYVEHPNTVLSHRGLQTVANEFSLPDVKPREVKKDIQLKQDARESVDEWAEKGEYGKKVEGLVEKAEKGEVLTDKERVILEGHLANVSQEVRGMNVKDPTYDAKMAEIKRLKDAGEKTRSEAGAALRVPMGGSRPRDITDFMVEEMDATKTNKLTEQQKETVQKEFNEISGVEKAYEEKIQALKNENAKMRAELEVKKAAKSTAAKGQKKDYSKERQEIFTSIKDKLKKARGDTSVTVVPYAKELFAIAPDVAKLVKSYAEQGIVELAEMVKKVHTDLKEAVPDIQEKDVRDLIAGSYNEQKPTRNKLAETLRDLKDEAKLINKLEDLENVEVPKDEKKKIERNRQITDLQEKIKGHDLTKLKEAKGRIKVQVDKIESQIKSGDFSIPEKTTVKLDKEGQELQDKLIKLKNERQLRILKEEYAASSAWNKIQTEAVNVLGVPRTIMASLDYSAPLRQALLPTISHPVMASKAAVEMFKSSFSKKNYDRWFFELENSDRYILMKDSKLGLTDANNPKLAAKEEQYMNGLAEKIPVIGKLIKGSERAYVTYLNKMRVDLFNRFADQMQHDGRTFENSPEAYKQMAAYVNNMTGRGDLGKTLNESAPVLNQLFFSPRLMASRINTLTYLVQPRFWNKVPREARNDFFKSLLSTAGVGLSILALAKMAGADTEDDPRSPDFGKIKSGNTRWDIWGGHQQYIRLAAQMITGKKKSSTSGKISEIGTDNPYSGTRGGLGLDFLRGKLAPVPSIGVDLLAGENTIGEKLSTDWKSEPGKIGVGEYLSTHLLPLTSTGLREAINDQGQKAWFTVGVPSVFGVGTQVYNAKK